MQKKRFIRLICPAILAGLMGSCVSLQDRTLTPQERTETEIVGSVTSTFTTFQFFNIPAKGNIKNKAYAELKKKAQQEYRGNVDIKNITIAGGFALPELLMLGGALLGGGVVGGGLTLTYSVGPGLAVGGGILLTGNFQKITATGDVVEYNAATGSSRTIQNNVQDAMARISEELIETLPAKASIAVLSIGSNDRALSENAVDELEFNLVDARKFTIVDRVRLDQIRREQNFQMSGDVSDDSAVTIGNMLGANIVIVGTISTTGSRGRITIRALDVKTAQIVTMAREPF
ncbi:MAG: CsgG/HfaB family protein [Treponema sp.]|nr:CsgG/HfaB family protein [Treponema sp.]